MFTYPYAYTVLDIYIGDKRRSTSGIPPLLRMFVGKRVDRDKESQSFNKRLERTLKRAGTLEKFLANLFADRGQDTGSLMNEIISYSELGFGEGRREELTGRLQASMLAHADEWPVDPDLVPWQTFSPFIRGLIGGIQDPSRRGTLQVWLDEILRLEQLSATSMRSEVNLRSEAVLSELACRPWCNTVAGTATYRKLWPGNNTPLSHSEITGPFLGLAATGLLWQLALFETLMVDLDGVGRQMMIVPERTKSGVWRSGPHWVRLIKDLVAAPACGGRGRPPVFLPTAGRMAPNSRNGSESIERANELGKLARGEAQLSFSVVRRHCREVDRLLVNDSRWSAAVKGRIGLILRFCGHVAGLFEVFERAYAEDSARTGKTELLDSLHSAWDDLPALRSAASEFWQEADRTRAEDQRAPLPS